MPTSMTVVLNGTHLDERAILTVAELCRTCHVDTKFISALVAEGVIEPKGNGIQNWRFSGICLRRTRIVLNLQRDLNVNLPGAALALELLEEIEQLRSRLND